MADVEHNTLHNGANQHAIHRWIVADQAARFLLTVVAGDVGKVALQQSNNTFWALIDHANFDNADGWQELDGITALAAVSSLTSTVTDHDARHLPGGADELISLAQGANLGDAAATIQWSTTDSYRRLPTNTLTANRTYTLGVTNVPTGAGGGACWVIDIDSQASGTVTFTNGGTGGGNFAYVVPTSTKVRLVFPHDGVNWLAPRIMGRP